MKNDFMKMNLQFFAEEGANEQDIADPALDIAEGANDPEPAKPVQSDEDNAKYAAARREAEQQARMQQEAVDNKFRELFGGYTNPVTGQPISGVNDYLQALEAQKQVEMQDNLRNSGVDPDLLNMAIQSNPIIRQAEEILAKQKEAEQQKMIDSELQEIYALDSTIKSPEDIINMENFEQFRGYVSKGYSFADAFKLANFSKLQQTNSNAAMQAAINQAKGTSHMTSTQGVASSGESLVDIPASELSYWQDCYPNLPMAELKKKYNATL